MSKNVATFSITLVSVVVQNQVPCLCLFAVGNHVLRLRLSF